jgi:predicted nucleotidyltransferase
LEYVDGIQVTGEFDHRFLASQRELLLEMRAQLTNQASRLEDEANALIEDVEMGDVQFDEEGGEGDTMVVERERDLVLSAQARQEVLEIDAALERVCRSHRIWKLSLFGSRLKGTARPDSDVDLLVEFMPDARPTLLDMAEIENELSELLGGVRVDLRTAQELSRYFRDAVVNEAEVQYQAR